MLIIADENIPEVEATFSRFGEVRLLSGRQITPADVKDADILLVRSVTKVNEPLLSASQVRFVGSATIGTDHIDMTWLEKEAIQFANAPGCNAVSAAEYVMSALFALAEDKGLHLQHMTMGIVGCGNVGSRVKARAEALGISCLVCDPPRAEKEGGEQFAGMDDIVQADIVTMHVPLTREGKHPTYRIVDSGFLDKLSSDAILVNTSRGEVIDESALHKKLNVCQEFRVVLDVWGGEPAINTDLVKKATIATPHIAGYSLDGKIRATEMLYHAVSDYLGEGPEALECLRLADPEQSTITPTGDDVHSTVHNCLKHVYDVRCDDQALRELLKLPDDQWAAGFDRLRKHYWPRRECSAYRVLGRGLAADTVKTLEAYGFTVV